MDDQNPFKWRHFEAEIILLCVRWYVRYSLSYRDLEEMMRERGLQVDHTTIYRWVQHYAPELEKRSRPHLKTTNDSWRVDETYMKVKKCHLLDKIYGFSENLPRCQALPANRLSHIIWHSIVYHSFSALHFSPS